MPVQKYWRWCFWSTVSGAKINTLVRTHRQCYFIWILTACVCAFASGIMCMCRQTGLSDPEEPSLRNRKDTEESLHSASSVFSLRTPSMTVCRPGPGAAGNPTKSYSLTHSLPLAIHIETCTRRDSLWRKHLHDLKLSHSLLLFNWNTVNQPHNAEKANVLKQSPQGESQLLPQLSILPLNLQNTRSRKVQVVSQNLMLRNKLRNCITLNIEIPRHHPCE